MNNANKLVGLDFEVFGRVQGVFFRKFNPRTKTRTRVSRVVNMQDEVLLVNAITDATALAALHAYDTTDSAIVLPSVGDVAKFVRDIWNDLSTYTRERGKKLGLKGWCMNTDRGTVLGRLEGEKSKIEDMKHWLRYTGSPQSSIDKAEFRNEKEIQASELSDFKIKH